MTADFDKQLNDLRLMKWEPKYHGELHGSDIPGKSIDLWVLVDSETGEDIVSLGVPNGRSDIAGYVAACCGNPVRWVTSTWQPDPRKDGVDDPEDKLSREASEVGDAIFKAYSDWLDRKDKQANAWTLNDALAAMWFAFCGQLNHEMRGRLLFKFLQLATADYQPPTGPGQEGTLR